MRKQTLSCLGLLLLPVAVLATSGKGEVKKDEVKKDETKKEESKKDVLSSDTFSAFSFRSIGPALISGRISDMAVDPKRPERFFLTIASGGVWKTENNGITFEAVFDGESSYSVGCITIDPNNPFTIWIGTGENNSQRSVGWGDGVYRSDDGGKSWKNMGLKNSEHVGMIRVDPRDSNIVYVAAQGPLWAPGGDRGLYKTTDGGKTWTAVLTVSPNTGVNEVHLDPRNPDVVYASTYQRRRHVWTLIDGGPESTIYKSTDAGKNFRKIEKGLPKVDKGKIGLAVSPVNPDVIYAVVEAAEGKGGFFRSIDRGESWDKRGDYVPGGPMYYNEIFCDPKNVDRVYSMDVFMKVTEDGGKTFKSVGEKSKHVDNHVIWIDPDNTDHLRVGGDGGLYESWDKGKIWQYTANLPLGQFYRVAVDESKPFYYVYGGTQDNASLGGPSRTNSASGIVNADWFITNGGDGFFSRIDPTNPNIVYAESQHGGIVRYDRASGEAIDIQPQEGKGDPANRWNWDSPLIISPHSHTRLYFASQRLYRSNDRGDTWVALSGDLSRQIDRNQLKVMDKVWPADAVAKNASTSFYGNITALAESPLVEGLLYVGTDDGLVQISEDSGKNWRKVETFPGVPEKTFVSRLEASLHDKNTVFIAFDNHKLGDFKPYLLKSTDRGKTWTSITSDLPAKEIIYVVVEDYKLPSLLFAGGEFGAYVSVDGGGKWIQLKGGLPTVPVRDIAVQKRENDLVLGTFGRSFYVLDDYTPLRNITKENLEKDALLFPLRDAYAYIEKTPIGGSGKGWQGESFYTAKNPTFGAQFTYYLKDELKTKKDLRREAEKEADKKSIAAPYPTKDQLREEAREEKPTIVLTVTDNAGNVIRRIKGETGKGMHRATWNLRYPVSTPAGAEANRGEDDDEDTQDGGPMVVPGAYRVSLSKQIAGVETTLAGPVEFNVVALGFGTLKPTDQTAVLAFQKKTARLQRAVLGARELLKETKDRLTKIKSALVDTQAAPAELAIKTRELERRLGEMELVFNGDREISRRNEPTLPSLVSRVESIVYSHWSTTSAPTTTMKQNYDIAAEQFSEQLPKLRVLVEKDLKDLEFAMEKAGAPYTPGRIPVWTKE